PRAPVMDQAGVLSARESSKLDSYLQSVREKGGPQIGILTIPSLQGQTIEEFSIKVADKWKLGGAKADDGAVIVLSVQDHKVRIEVGQGLEGNVTDLYSKRIIDRVMIP